VAVLVTLCVYVAQAEVVEYGEGKTEDIFFMVPGGGKLTIDAELKNGYKCNFSYQAQGGTHEEWHMTMEMLDDGKAVHCTVERAGSSSYLFVESFEIELTGPKVAITDIEVKDSQRDNKDLNPEEYSKEKTSVSSVQGKFKNHLEKVAVYSPLVSSEL